MDYDDFFKKVVSAKFANKDFKTCKI